MMIIRISDDKELHYADLNLGLTDELHPTS